MNRSRLLLLNGIRRNPLRLISESDREFRSIERAPVADPYDAVKRQKLSKARKREGGHPNWRWNGKGWFTRPQWNGGNCPEGSQPTQHNTCIGDKDSDKSHYDDQPQAERPFGRRPWQDRAELVRTPQVVNSTLRVKQGSRINWDHPHGPRIYTPYSDVKPRPLPESPEHLPSAFTHKPTGQGWRAREARKEYDRLHKHYVDQGFDPKYVHNALSDREQPHVDWDSLTDKDVKRLPPDRMSKVRALRKKGVKDQRRREAEHAAWVQQHVDEYGYEPHEGWDDDDYDDYDDHDYWDRSNHPGGYKNHPGYPGHPDYPEFDGRRADAPGDRPPPGYGHQEEPDTGDPGSPFRPGPQGQDRPRWPRTGERPDRHGTTAGRFVSNRARRGRR